VKERVPSPWTEARLEELRREAGRAGRVEGPGVRPPGAPFPVATPETGYYGLPPLKAPTWTWEVPVYFFVGGAAGASAVIAAAARAGGAPRSLVSQARWVAAAGAALSPPLLIADLGRPERFLNMLRVFKPQSAMSMGAWTLVAFSSAAGASAFADALDRLLGGSVPVRVVADAAGTLAAATGLVMATYTGVLVGTTAIPAWSENATRLPIHFAASGLGAAVGALELSGGGHPALNALGIGAAAVETAIGWELERRNRRSLDPLKTGMSGAIVRAGGVLSGPVTLLLRALGGRRRRLRVAAAWTALAGSLLTRIGWVAAGYASSRRPLEDVPLEDVPPENAPARSRDR
jgi:hypothetical protein